MPIKMDSAGVEPFCPYSHCSWEGYQMSLPGKLAARVPSTQHLAPWLKALHQPPQAGGSSFHQLPDYCNMSHSECVSVVALRHCVHRWSNVHGWAAIGLWSARMKEGVRGHLQVKGELSTECASLLVRHSRQGEWKPTSTSFRHQ